jgi:hypothetical protein
MDMQRLIGKILVALAIGVAIGYAVGRSIEADYRRGEHLTLEAYTTDYERYRAELMEGPVSTPAYVIFGVGLTLVVFGLYEGLGWGAGWAIGRVAGRREASTALPPPPSR